MKEIDSIEKAELLNLVPKYVDHLQTNPNTHMARIYGLFCLRIENASKYYFIIMQNLDFFPNSSVIFRYDLKFSEVNRKHVDSSSDLLLISQMLVRKDEMYRELINLKNEHRLMRADTF